MSQVVKTVDADTLKAVKFVHQQVRAGFTDSWDIRFMMRKRLKMDMTTYKIAGIRRSMNYQAGRLANAIV